MNNPIVRQLLNFIILLAIQVLILNHVRLFGFLNPNLYILALLLLPMDMPKSAQYLIGFVTGFVVDVFLMTLGVHTTACLLLMVIRPYVMGLLSTNKKKDDKDAPIPSRKDIKWLSAFTLLMVLAHQTIVTMLEIFSFQRFGLTLLSIILNTFFTSLLILCAEYLFYTDKKLNNS